MQTILTLPGHSQSVTGLAFLSDPTQLLSVSHDATLKLWRLPEGQQAAQFTGPAGSIRQLMVKANLVAAACDLNKLVIWRLPEGALIKDISVDARYLACLVFSVDGTQLLGGTSEGQVISWGVPDFQKVSTLTVGFWEESVASSSNSVNALALSPDGTMLAVALEDGSLSLWDRVQGREIRTLLDTQAGKRRTICGVIFDRSSLIACVDQQVLRWQLPAGRSWWRRGKATSVVQLQQPINSLAISGNYLAIASETGLTLHDTHTGQIDTFTRPSTSPTALVFSPDGNSLACGWTDGTIQLLRLQS